MNDFERFFAGENYQGNSDWDRLLRSTEVPGMPGASWDRRAAWLVFNGFNPAVDPIPEVVLPAKPNLLTALLPPAPVTTGLLPR